MVLARGVAPSLGHVNSIYFAALAGYVSHSDVLGLQFQWQAWDRVLVVDVKSLVNVALRLLFEAPGWATTSSSLRIKQRTSQVVAIVIEVIVRPSFDQTRLNDDSGERPTRPRSALSRGRHRVLDGLLFSLRNRKPLLQIESK